MNPDDYEREDHRWRQPDPAPERTPLEAAHTAAGAVGTPYAVRTADLERRRSQDFENRDLDPDTEAESEREEPGRERQRARGVEWVRPTDLMVRGGGVVAGRGISFQAELARTVRTPVADRLQRAGERARQLPPLAAFGRGSGRRGAGRSSVGMS
ncbi:hypothetical protein [Aeromicrobium piscarium]|uniref:Uncharacterized protein n=1 Tax=Aeromicrobium piscarium TaxID=2590901 RepID=A0A554S7Y8_9ACTN|nr:hypothetical protein [Aeromicrobium piscarium]TSD62435.1 hypothetical protein FNM00_12480 [Aeromicrobium piscarium]